MTKSHQTLKKHTTKYIHSSPATATTSRRRAVKHVPLGGPYSHPSFIDRGFVENGLITSREVNEARWPHTCSRPCAFQAKKIGKKRHGKKSAPPKTHHVIQSSPTTACNSRPHLIQHVRRVRPYSPASIGQGLVEIRLVQLSQSVKTTNVTHTLTDTQTDRQAS